MQSGKEPFQQQVQRGQERNADWEGSGGRGHRGLFAYGGGTELEEYLADMPELI